MVIHSVITSPHRMGAGDFPQNLIMKGRENTRQTAPSSVPQKQFTASALRATTQICVIGTKCKLHVLLESLRSRKIGCGGPNVNSMERKKQQQTKKQDDFLIVSRELTSVKVESFSSHLALQDAASHQWHQGQLRLEKHLLRKRRRQTHQSHKASSSLSTP